MIKVMMMMMIIIIMMLLMMLLMMMMNYVHLDIPLLANFKKLQPFHDSGAEQRQGCTAHIWTLYVLIL